MGFYKDYCIDIMWEQLYEEHLQAYYCNDPYCLVLGNWSAPFKHYKQQTYTLEQSLLNAGFDNPTRLNGVYSGMLTSRHNITLHTTALIISINTLKSYLLFNWFLLMSL